MVVYTLHHGLGDAKVLQHLNMLPRGCSYQAGCHSRHSCQIEFWCLSIASLLPDISKNSGFSSQIIHFNTSFRYPYFWKHPSLIGEFWTIFDRFCQHIPRDMSPIQACPCQLFLRRLSPMACKAVEVTAFGHENPGTKMGSATPVFLLLFSLVTERCIQYIFGRHFHVKKLNLQNSSIIIYQCYVFISNLVCTRRVGLKERKRVIYKGGT